METKSVKSIPKDFSEAEPVNGDKLIRKDFSEAKPVNGDKIS